MRLLPLPAFSDNYIWALADDADCAVFVDPGDAAPVLRAADSGLLPSAILITHHHPDHIGGLPELLRRWPQLPVYAPEDARIAFATTRVGDGHRVAVDPQGWEFDVLAVPGHTRSHVAYFGTVEHRAVLFCGDTLFSLGCGRLFEGTPAQMLASLDRISALPGETSVCCTHEYTLANAAFASIVDPENPVLAARVAEVRAQRGSDLPTLPTTIDQERATNPFLGSDREAIRAAIARRLGRPPADRVETFAELRRWKDDFKA